MSRYYAIERSDEYLMHYGVKGMKWGVRKAIEKGNKKALDKHFRKANKKLEKLIGKADLVRQSVGSDNNLVGIAGGLGSSALMGGMLGISALSAKRGLSSAEKAAFGSTIGVPAAIAAGNAISKYKKEKRLTTKGHQKAVQKVKDWQKEMGNAFKGTEKEKLMRSPYEDKYHAMVSILPDVNGKTYGLGKSISGSHLTKDYKGKDKDRFIKDVNDIVTKYRADSPLSAGLITPSGHYYDVRRPENSATIRSFSEHVATKQKKRRKK